VRPNWPLIGIIAAAVVAVGIVVTIFVSTSGAGSVAVPTAPTTDQLDAKHADWSTPLSGTVTEKNGCLFATVDGSDRFVIWPQGWRKNGDAMREPDGTAVAVGATLTGTGTLLSRDDALKASDAYSQYLGDMTTTCLGDAAGAKDAIVVLVSATAS
jgi:hypothetical protein